MVWISSALGHICKTSGDRSCVKHTLCQCFSRIWTWLVFVMGSLHLSHCMAISCNDVDDDAYCDTERNPYGHCRRNTYHTNITECPHGYPPFFLDELLRLSYTALLIFPDSKRYLRTMPTNAGFGWISFCVVALCIMYSNSDSGTLRVNPSHFRMCDPSTAS